MTEYRKRIIALTHSPSPKLDQCELTHQERVHIDLRLAGRQHAAYCQALGEAGADVRTLETNRQFPDSVFIEDTAVVLDEIAVLCSMGAATRRAEPAGVASELGKWRSLVSLPPGATLEGGDVVRVGRKFFVGLSTRTNPAGVGALAEITRPFGYDVAPIQITGCLHMKSALTALPDGRLLANRGWFNPGPLSELELIDVPSSELSAANVAYVGNLVFISAAYPRTAEMLRRSGYEVKAVELSEFAKAEGCVSCLSILFET